MEVGINADTLAFIFLADGGRCLLANLTHTTIVDALPRGQPVGGVDILWAGVRLKNKYSERRLRKNL